MPQYADFYQRNGVVMATDGPTGPNGGPATDRYLFSTVVVEVEQ